ncbi:hypothetical protein F7725_019469 [Dissostichus mawsoni]|uniref:Transmembrane protein 63A n=1 Tax=Dissostichus mawsoni TaxID=36200 RepID=A0A7J5YK52_DISMA|nr:hypothetical protein F7725_019469 [Dissostichus mawsoni]
MSALWWEQWPLSDSNGTTPAGFPDNASCFSSTQSTVLKGVSFGGVPIVLLLDFCVFLVLLMVFSIIRRKFWDYGRLALVTDEGEGKIKARCGMDAVHYLSFQRHLIVLLIVLTVTSLSIILPVNMTGDLLGNNPESFGRTTVGNIQIGSNLLWLHTVFAVLYLILTVVVLRHHTSQMKGMRRETARDTLFVCSVPKTATEEAVKTHFIEAYPSCRVCAVTLGYNVAKLMHLDKEKQRAGKNLRYYERVLEKTGKLELINPRLCGHLCCCASSEKVDAVEFYRTQEKDLLEEVRKQTELVPQRPLGMAFLSFTHSSILKDFNALECGGTGFLCGRTPQPSSDSSTLKVNNWSVSFAPHPKNVFWENLSLRGFHWYMRYLMLNFFLFFLLTFLTTPTIIINTMDKFNVTMPIYYLNSPIISQFFPTLLLWSFSALLPTIVYYSTIGEAHWSRCVFLPDQGAFFVNYVITAALVGSGMDLLRLPGLLLYIIRMVFARSAAERKYVKENQAYEFEYGAMYGWCLCVFTVIMAYSIICPIIVPFGLLYMMLKHLVDKHNMYFAYLPARLDRQVHLGAVNQALAAPIICLIWLYFFSVLRQGFWAPTALFTLVVLCITVFICIGYTCFGNFKYLSPHNYEVKEEDEDTEKGVEENTMVYLPRVLDPKSPASAQEGSKMPSYGSTVGSPAHSTSPLTESVSDG